MKTKRVHRKIIMPCNLLPGNECKKEYIYKKPQLFSDKLDQSHPVQESDSDSEIVIAYPKEVCPKAVRHSNIKRKGSDSSNNISQPFSTTDKKNLEMMSIMNFSHVDPPELEQNEKYSHIIS